MRPKADTYFFEKCFKIIAASIFCHSHQLLCNTHATKIVPNSIKNGFFAPYTRVPYDNVHVMPECFLPTRIAFGLSLNSPFKQALDLKLEQMKEGGIVSC